MKRLFGIMLASMVLFCGCFVSPSNVREAGTFIDSTALRVETTTGVFLMEDRVTHGDKGDRCVILEYSSGIRYLRIAGNRYRIAQSVSKKNKEE